MVVLTSEYDSPQIIYNNTGYDLGTDIDFVIEPEGTKRAELPSDYYFVDDNGKIYDLSKYDKMRINKKQKTLRTNWLDISK